jgi:hypothetical protein
MKIRDNMNAVIEGLQKDHGLLAAYLEATDKIDWRALHKRVVIGDVRSRRSEHSDEAIFPGFGNRCHIDEEHFKTKSHPSGRCWLRCS